MFDFLANLWKQLTGGKPRRPLRHIPNRPGLCSYCGSALRSLDSRQCFTCGFDWHDVNNVIVRTADPSEAARLQTLAAQRGARLVQVA